MVASVDITNGSMVSSVTVSAGSTQAQAPQQDVPVNRADTAVEKVSISPAATIQLGRDQTILGGKLVNQTDKVYAKQQDLLSKMSSQLQGILKQFPPYGTEDPQRVAYLRGFSSLKQEIESLQVPKDAQAEQGLPKGFSLPGQGMPALPALDGARVSDQQVADAAKRVQSTYDQITAQRHALAQSVQAALGGSAYANQVTSLS